MSQLKRVFCVFSLCIFQYTFAQDIHWSQFNDNPIFQNPANSGNFKGDYRFISNYRNQWKSVTIPFSTINFTADFKTEKIKKLGVGIVMFNDGSGDGKFKTIEIQSNFAYKFNLTKDEKQILRAGINIGLNHRQVNYNLLSFDNQYNGINYDPTLPTNEIYTSQKNTNLSIGLGATYEYLIDEKQKISAGIGFYNLNRPNQGFYNEIVPRDIRTCAFFKWNKKLNYDWNLLPSLQINLQGKYREIVIGSSLKYTLIEKPKEYRAIYFGAWFRNRDAFYLSCGVDYQNWFVGLSYDINVSKLIPASNFRGGFEIAVRYILFRFKPQNITHRICPDYI
ncbi:MAG: PorP/SprF family type IX secretion system membrane protein [Flavobacteriia bacterium]|nr:PorP/SprF family type IX secretion system membrane protein [Flavobacteriia bacterium]